LSRRYAEPHRRYHTAAHLEAVLRDAEWLAAEVGLDARERAVVTLAACAHDVVYDARPGADEQASAAWAQRHLVDCGLDTGLVGRVADLVLATAAHTAADDDAPAAVLLDADLAVLGCAPHDYALYATAVRQEFGSLPEDEWRAGRARLVRSLLDRDPLYRTRPARRRWEAQARRNLAGELAKAAG
jgi:predicted metal-dependent HD superfamily phosphohydrolase